MSEELKIPPELTTDAEVFDWLLCCQERLRRWNYAEVERLKKTEDVAAAIAWHRATFRPRNTLLVHAILPLREKLYPTDPDLPEEEPMPWEAAKTAIRDLLDDDPKLDIEPDDVFRPVAIEP